MSKQLLIYENAVALSSERHGNWGVEVGTNFSFAKHVNSVPLMAVEFPHAAIDYPIVFTKNEDEVAPAIILGLNADQNLFLNAEGQWDARYIPAFIRRYPFVFALSDDKSTFTLCIDEAFSGFNPSGKGQKLYENGQPSNYIQTQLQFLQEFENQFARTRAFCRNLDELELLEPAHAQLTTQGGERSTLTGFYCVNRAKLRALSAKTLARLAATDELELIYSHLVSLQTFPSLTARMDKLPKEKVAAVSGGKGKSGK